MPFTKTTIPDLLIYEPRVFEDPRGYFFESYNANTFLADGVEIKFVQDNQAKSSYGVIRGLHYQLAPYAQTKLIRVLSGAILDVAVDIRKGSPTYGQVFTIELTAENKKQLWIPEGFAHGFVVLSDIAEVLYKTTNYWAPTHERCILWNDDSLQIDWKITKDPLLSKKDMDGIKFNMAEVFK